MERLIKLALSNPITTPSSADYESKTLLIYIIAEDHGNQQQQ